MLNTIFRAAAVCTVVPCLLLTAGCSREETEQPTLADSTFISVLAELHLARARQDLQDDLPASIRDSIFRRYQTDSTAFEETFTYYTDHPDEYTQIYGRLLDHLNEERDAEQRSAASIDSSSDERRRR